MHYYYDHHQDDIYRQQPSVQFLPPSVIDQYVNQWITTSIPGYGQVIAYVTDFNRRNGMVSMFIYQAPYYQPQFIQVHNSDLVGIAPYYGPIPPRPHQGPGPGQQPRPPRPRPPFFPWWFWGIGGQGGFYGQQSGQGGFGSQSPGPR
ncbi:hypothetical protein BTR22_00915 [Alkalihalophilus pseudofirmus]|uniref:hypothetical protein n=1 Tax=Alkalihalophilus pseudofirmus TaxID=79885 RepID=UPI00095276F2|nr:hypothetical protein BTR22_00915 [Alkalihalophilus pseudofirmus]